MENISISFQMAAAREEVDAYAEPANFLEIDVTDAKTHGQAPASVPPKSCPASPLGEARSRSAQLLAQGSQRRGTPTSSS